MYFQCIQPKTGQWARTGVLRCFGPVGSHKALTFLETIKPALKDISSITPHYSSIDQLRSLPDILVDYSQCMACSSIVTAGSWGLKVKGTAYWMNSKTDLSFFNIKPREK